MDLKPLRVNKNTSGSFVEAFKLPNDGQISYIIVNPKETRGNHYHERKTEYFLVIYGAATIVSKDRDTGDVMQVVLSGYKPLAVTIPPNHTHYLTATDEGCICLIWCDEQFNEADADTFPEEV
jgi:UDP-2-acetamido-2,6-beta-L-arabino-hexul-4-ose reductase